MVRTKNPAPKRFGGAVPKTKAMINKGSIKRPQVNNDEIQESTKTMIPPAAFQRLMKDIVRPVKPDLHFQSMAVECIQAVVEAKMSKVFEDASMCALHAKRVTIMSKDFKLACRMNGIDNV